MPRCRDDLATPLHEVAFLVVDLETTGASPAECGITEIGAVKVRAGECLGTFQTLVNPQAPVPPFITGLTGITDAMVSAAPAIESVLPSFLEFAAGCVVVGHNVRFDLSFLRAATERSGYPPTERHAPVVDTLRLARPLTGDDVPDCRLSTLAQHYRLPHRPTHRALDDALATGDLLHALLERAGTYGALALDDLLALPWVAGHAQVGKLRLTSRLPRSPGVYLFRDRGGGVLHVGTATNVRRRVRAYFSSRGGRTILQLFRETAAIDHVECASPDEAARLEAHLLRLHQPRFDRRARRPAPPEPVAVGGH